MRKTGASPLARTTFFAVIVAVLGLVLSAGSDASAQSARPCADDAARLCKDVQPGGGRLAKCLKEHENVLSPACKQRIVEVKEWGREVHQACEDDVMTLCKGVIPGGGRLLRCLKEHENELSPDCKAKLTQPREKSH